MTTGRKRSFSYRAAGERAAVTLVGAVRLGMRTLGLELPPVRLDLVRNLADGIALYLERTHRPRDARGRFVRRQDGAR